jgi:hypothetical protein
VERLQNGDMVIAFREAARRRVRTHIDMTSKAVLVRSRDQGKTWDPASKVVIRAEKGRGMQDPSVRQLKNGALIANYFVWTTGGADEVPTGHAWLHSSDADHYSWTTGVYTTRSFDNGMTWEEPVKVPSPTGDCASTSDPIIELPNGDLLIPIIGGRLGEKERTMIMRSSDKGKTWRDPVVMAFDPLGHFHFDEPSLLYLPSGKLIAMHRVHMYGESDYGYYLYQTESRDLGQTWSAPRKTSIWGHPPHLLRLRSGRLLCVYGYRRPPYGIRACLSHDEGETWDIANEFILRSDGIDADVGYPTSTQLPDGTIFTAWYITEPDQEKSAVGVKHTIFAYDRPLAFLGGTFYREP